MAKFVNPYPIDHYATTDYLTVPQFSQVSKKSGINVNPFLRNVKNRHQTLSLACPGNPISTLEQKNYPMTAAEKPVAAAQKSQYLGTMKCCITLCKGLNLPKKSEIRT